MAATLRVISAQLSREILYDQCMWKHAIANEFKKMNFGDPVVISSGKFVERPSHARLRAWHECVEV